MTEKPIVLVAVGDLHAGSRLGLCLPDSPHCNTAQRALYKCWHDLAKEWSSPDILICNGDAIEGKARKESGVPCWTMVLREQIDCAAALLREWKAKDYRIINGTGYHVDGEGESLEYYLGKELGATVIGPDGEQSAEELFLRIRRFTFHISHHISTGSGWYKTTPLARELVFALLNETSKHRVDVILRSHVHYFCGVDFRRQRGYTLPCWQLQTRYMTRKSALGMVPDIGAIRFRIYPNEIRMDKRFFRPVEIKPKLFVYEEREK